MNVNMWQHPATQANLEILRRHNVRVVGTRQRLPSMRNGGRRRLAEESAVVAAVAEVLSARTVSGKSDDLAGETVLVTAGGTREPIDPVRFIGNRSSGKMGYALAAEARGRGARVILISAPTSLAAPAGCELIPVTTSEEMRQAVLGRHSVRQRMVIMAAAVSDYRVETATQKLKREGPRTLQLEPTKDILHEVVERRETGTLVIGFAAETEDLLANGRAKLARKGRGRPGAE